MIRGVSCDACGWKNANITQINFCPKCGSDSISKSYPQPVDKPVDNFAQPVDKPVDNFSQSLRYKLRVHYYLYHEEDSSEHNIYID